MQSLVSEPWSRDCVYIYPANGRGLFLPTAITSWGSWGQPRKQLPPQPGGFYLIIKKCAILCYPNGRLFVVCQLFPDAFCWVLLCLFEAVLVAINPSGFPEGAHNRGFTSNTTIYTISLSLNEDWPLVHLACLMISSVPHYCIYFHHLSQFVLKMDCFITFQ